MSEERNKVIDNLIKELERLKEADAENCYKELCDTFPDLSKVI